MWRLSVIAISLVSLVAWGSAADPSDKPVGGTISGTVLKDGKPVANARVGLIAATAKAKGKGLKHGAAPADQSPATQPSQSTAKGKKHQPLATATTNADGKFTLEGVAPGDYIVMAGEKAQGRGKQRVTVTSGESASVSIDLQPPKPKNKSQKPNKLGL